MVAKLNKSELEKVLDQLTTDVAALLQPEAKLAKADPGEEAPAEKTPEGSSSDAPPEASSAPAPGPEASASAGPPAGADAGGPPPGPEASASPDAGAQGDPSADATSGPEALKSEYAKLPVEELKMHFLACKAALMELLGGQGAPDAGAGAGGPPPGPEASASAGPPAGAPGTDAGPPPGPPMGKGELPSDGSGKISAGTMAKSEAMVSLENRLAKAEIAMVEVEGLKASLAAKEAENASLNENIGKIAVGFQKLLTKQSGLRKSISGISVIQKPGTVEVETPTVDVKSLGRPEIIARLTKATASNTLKKSERDLINQFVLGHAPVDSIAKFIS